MRSPLDRLRHAVSFEVIALLLVVPLGAAAFGMPIHDIGVVGVVSATLATLWNLLYNWFFDLALSRARGTTLKTLPLRLLHALLFEGGLLLVLLPFIAWYLGVTLWQALVMDLSFALFYLVYAFGFNWGYDRLFPLPEWQRNAEA
ncbi:PACE efflux transporter [Pararhodobacter aggregans]|uniref:PACE efflux transporter n=1 Tax=Pararhodobacter aggregans TaxID=404875 RepID=UPI003A9084A0